MIIKSLSFEVSTTYTTVYLLSLQVVYQVLLGSAGNVGGNDRMVCLEDKIMSNLRSKIRTIYDQI